MFFRVAALYTKRNKFWHPYLINTIEMRSLWMEIKYVKSITRLLNIDLVNKGGFDLSKEVLSVCLSVGPLRQQYLSINGQMMQLSIL